MKALDLFEAIKNRRSVRAFRSNSISEDILRKLLEAACWAPSAGNLQSWEFIVVKDLRVKKELCKAALGQCFIQEAPVNIVVCANVERSSSRYGSRGELFSICDSSAATQNLLLTVHALGLGACWIGAFHDADVSKVLNLPEEIRPIAIVPIGYPDEKPSPPSRLPRDAVTHNEKYEGSKVRRRFIF